MVYFVQAQSYILDILSFLYSLLTCLIFAGPVTYYRQQKLQGSGGTAPDTDDTLKALKHYKNHAFIYYNYAKVMQ